MSFDHIPRHLFFAAKEAVCLFAGLCFFYACCFSQQARNPKKSPPEEPFPAINVNIREHLKVFNESDDHATYHVSLCADVPNNKKPLQVAHHQETGHVFLILQMIRASNDTVRRVFGYYPRRGLPTLFFKKISSLIKDNSYREYDVEISKEITAEQFDTLLAKAATWAERKYHINKYNCYDYALQLFNIGAGENPLPVNHVRFPFIFGRGGSPCSIYKSLKELQVMGSAWTPYIKFGEMKAPVSTGRLK